MLCGQMNLTMATNLSFLIGCGYGAAPRSSNPILLKNKQVPTSHLIEIGTSLTLVRTLGDARDDFHSKTSSCKRPIGPGGAKEQ